jgi:DNA-directed RNA polymerase specialized sigma54-like protein
MNYTFYSGSKTFKILTEKGVKISSKTFIKYRDTGKIYKNWSFYTKNKHSSSKDVN